MIQHSLPPGIGQPGSVLFFIDTQERVEEVGKRTYGIFFEPGRGYLYRIVCTIAIQCTDPLLRCVNPSFRKDCSFPMIKTPALYRKQPFWKIFVGPGHPEQPLLFKQIFFQLCFLHHDYTVPHGKITGYDPGAGTGLPGT